MKSDYVLIGAVLSLTIGLGVILGNMHGSAGFNAAYPVAGATLQVSVNTAGWPVMVGVPLTVLGLLLLIAAAVSAIARQIPGKTEA